MTQDERRNFLIKILLDENEQYKKIDIPKNEVEQKQLLRGLMNVREAKPISAEFIEIQDKYLTEETRRKGITDVDSLIPVKDGIYIWQGDITTLKCEAIVNAANSGMTGCYVPNHRCIDNCIHFYAGIQLRLVCADIMSRQGHYEPTGEAKITKSYNLPCNYIIHTVGPIVKGRLTNTDCSLLKKCYDSCLRVADENGLNSIAFCCISTGEFHFPNDKAAEIAVETITEFLKRKTSLKKVVFNVFKDEDREIYEKLLCR